MSFAEIASPLTDLTRKNARFVWSEACQKTFDTLKDSLVSAPILGMSLYKGKFILDTDASDFSIGAVLSQEQDGVERVVAYASRRLSDRERNYRITRRELLAVVQFVKHFRAYILGRPFDIRTDHAALRWLKRNPERIGQQARWLELLEELDYTVILLSTDQATDMEMRMACLKEHVINHDVAQLRCMWRNDLMSAL